MKKIIIVGGVAGGASCATRLRRNDEQAEITVYERGPYISFANCGLPYHVGKVIEREESLLLASPKLFADRFRIQVKPLHEVLAIYPEKKSISIKNLQTGETLEDHYDELVLSPGAAPLKPNLLGLDSEGVFTLRNIPDMRQIIDWLKTHQVKHAAVVGGGFIGLEMVENLHHLGLSVTLIQNSNQLMATMDAEMTTPLVKLLEQKGIKVLLENALLSVEKNANGLVAKCQKEDVSADVMILGLGVRPEISLAQAAGLKIGKRGGIAVDDQMKTSHANIYAVGDAVEVRDIQTQEMMLLALAGPANRQGRIAADVISGKNATFRGVQGTAICGLFDLALAQTGLTEKTLQREGITDYEKIYLHPKNHVGYYPGAKTIHLKLLFSKNDGKIYGMQAVGEADVARKIDTVSALIQKDGSVYDLEEMELCYAPQYGAAKDALNYAGFIASNHLRGDLPITHWHKISADDFVLDVRDDDEYEESHYQGAKHIPLNDLRDRLSELPKDKKINVYCGVGQRAYYAVRILLQNGFNSADISGGWITYTMV